MGLMPAQRWEVSSQVHAGAAYQGPDAYVIYASANATGSLSTASDAAMMRILWSARSTAVRPTVVILDLSGLQILPLALRDMLLPLCRDVQSKRFGPVVLVVAAADPGVADVVRWMAASNDLALFLVPSPAQLAHAEPIGRLTQGDQQTLEILSRLGGWTTASMMASTIGIEPSAANNRLGSVSQKGYSFRVDRPRSEGDLYVDPRASSPNQVVDAMLADSRQALPDGEHERTRRLLMQTLHMTPEGDGPAVY